MINLQGLRLKKDVRPSEALHLPQQDLIISYSEKKPPRGREAARLQWVTVLREVLEPAAGRLDQL